MRSANRNSVYCELCGLAHYLVIEWWKYVEAFIYFHGSNASNESLWRTYMEGSGSRWTSVN